MWAGQEDRTLTLALKRRMFLAGASSLTLLLRIGGTGLATEPSTDRGVPFDDGTGWTD